MALIQCQECKKTISDQAGSCPHCGYKIINKKKKGKEEKMLKKTLKKTGDLAASPIKVVLKTIINYLLLLAVAATLILASPYFLSGLFSNILEAFNPFDIQQKATIAVNKTNDSFSTIDGTEVRDVPLTSISKYFNKTASKEKITLDIPKILNASPLFDTNNPTSNLMLKRAFINSINEKQLKEETNNFVLMYNGNELLALRKGFFSTSKVVNDSVTAQEEKVFSKKLSEILKNEKLNFKGWVNENNVAYEFKSNNEVILSGTAKVKNEFGFNLGWIKNSEKEINISFKRVKNKWEYVDNSLRVGDK